MLTTCVTKSLTQIRRETEREFNIHDKWCVFTETERAERDCSLGLFSHGDSETKSCFLSIIETIAVWKLRTDRNPSFSHRRDNDSIDVFCKKYYASVKIQCPPIVSLLSVCRLWKIVHSDSRPLMRLYFSLLSPLLLPRCRLVFLSVIAAVKNGVYLS